MPLKKNNFNIILLSPLSLPSVFSSFSGKEFHCHFSFIWPTNILEYKVRNNLCGFYEAANDLAFLWVERYVPGVLKTFTVLGSRLLYSSVSQQVTGWSLQVSARRSAIQQQTEELKQSEIGLKNVVNVQEREKNKVRVEHSNKDKFQDMWR